MFYNGFLLSIYSLILLINSFGFIGSQPSSMERFKYSYLEVAIMSKDVLFADDDLHFIRAISRFIEKNGFNTVTFTDFHGALDYVSREKPYAYFVDMKPLGVVPEDDSLTEKQIEILDLPERIFEKVKRRGLQEKFYFVSGHRSKHDMEVLARTGANYTDKMSLCYRMKKIFSEV